MPRVLLVVRKKEHMALQPGTFPLKYFKRIICEFGDTHECRANFVLELYTTSATT